MAESKLVKLNFETKSLGCIVISDLVVANLFMHSLPDMILLHLAMLFTLKVFLHEILNHLVGLTKN